mmetsp:Transcript_299/g.2393  ORF Transcript_299/g.2393 Transcript_299/m.2393 type:complete len:200 (+) Transcript_299:2047-2646(+)
MPDERPKRSASSLICTASSLVGARISMVGPTRGSFCTFLMCMIPGNKYPQVLPLPVLAMATTSLPCKAHAQDWAWMGVGAVNPALLTSSMMSIGSPAASKEVYGSGHPCPSTFISCFLRYASPSSVPRTLEKSSFTPGAVGGAWLLGGTYASSYPPPYPPYPLCSLSSYDGDPGAGDGGGNVASSPGRSYVVTFDCGFQ